MSSLGQATNLQSGNVDLADLSHSPDIINCQLQHNVNDMSEYQGDRLNYVKRNQIRIGFVNIDGIPAINNDAKNFLAKSTIVTTTKNST